MQTRFYWNVAMPFCVGIICGSPGSAEQLVPTGTAGWESLNHLLSGPLQNQLADVLQKQEHLTVVDVQSPTFRSSCMPTWAGEGLAGSRWGLWEPDGVLLHLVSMVPMDPRSLHSKCPLPLISPIAHVTWVSDG